MGTIEKRNEDFYTKNGLEALIHKIRSFMYLYNNKKFPQQVYVIGFGQLTIEDKKECKARILELSHCIGRKTEFKIEITKFTNGQTFEKEVVI